ncbi:MAG: DinB family protein [Cyclobacteriaceae bacterium]
MEKVVEELNAIVAEFTEKMAAFSEAELAEKPLPNKWSKKEVIGHLIDSGQNNLRRFIVAQHETTPPKIVYDQDFWVKANNYQKMTGKDVIELWRLTNNQISSILITMDSDKYVKTCNTSKEVEQLRSLEWLAADYVKHLKHHLNQVIKGSFDITYP